MAEQQTLNLPITVQVRVDPPIYDINSNKNSIIQKEKYLVISVSLVW